METMRERFIATASELLDHDPHLAVVLADISADQFGRAAARHPGRVINVGIREQLLIGVAGGLALAGLRPIAHTFPSFLIERPFEQVKLDLGHQDAGAVLVSSGASYDMSSMGRTHQAPGDVALLDTLDGWTIHVPGHPDEAEVLLRHASAGNGRVYLRLSGESNPEPRAVTPGRFEVVRSGQAGTVIAVGPMLQPVLNAVKDLDVTVLYAVTVRPFDAVTLRQAVGASASTDVVLAEPYLAGTSNREVDEALLDVPHRVLGLGVGRAELRRYGTPADHAAAHGLDATSLRRRISAVLR
jgi:transketolase